jgi:hypothetical protein
MDAPQPPPPQQPPPTAPQLSLNKHQWEVFSSKARFRVLVAGRRFGKTELALAEILNAATQGGPGKQIWYLGPNDRQSKRIFWERLKALTQRFWSKKPSEAKMRIDLTSGSSIFVSGAFHPDSLRGDGLDFVVLDEFSSMKPNAWREVIRPALTDRKGRALFIGTPQGRNHLYDQFEFAAANPQWQSFHFTTEQGGLVDPEELASVALELDADTYRQEFDAAFAKIGKYRAYHAFDPAANVQHRSFDGLHPLIWSIDFNVNPMIMLLMQQIGEHVHVLEEIVLKPSAHTELACQSFLKRALQLFKQAPWYQQPLTVHVYGDASGNQRRTSGTATDWTLIKQFFKTWVGTFEPFFFTASANPLIRDRVTCVNSRLRNAAGDPRLFIDPSCKELIRDLEEVSWALDSNGAATHELNKKDPARTHASDALGYFISQKFPLRPKIGYQNTPLYLG